MPRIQIPPDQKDGFQRLHQLHGKALTDFTGALERAPMKMYYFDLAKDIAENLDSIPAEDVSSMVEALWQLEFMRVAWDAPRAPFMNDIRMALLRDGIVNDSDADEFVSTLDRLVTTPSLSLSAKARSLLTDGNSYCRSRVLTDIRPVFGSDVVEEPKAVLVVHHLTLSYHSGGPRVEDAIISLDSDDIDDLIETLQRAKQKQKRLQSTFSGEFKVPYLGSE